MDAKYVLEVIKLLKKTYPNPKIALVHKNPLELLVATILSAQCTDERVNIVTKDLFKKYKTISDYANAKPAVFEKDIKSVNFYKTKAKNIIAACKKIRDEFNNKIPQNMQDLICLPGVARKTANVLLSSAFGKAEGIVVDTHVCRLCQRLGLTKNKQPVKIEQDLMKIIPEKDWRIFSLMLIRHGREVCKARTPICHNCNLSYICPSSQI